MKNNNNTKQNRNSDKTTAKIHQNNIKQNATTDK